MNHECYNRVISYIAACVPNQVVSARRDCPICHGENTFSISKDRGVIKFHCHRASCDCSGAYSAAMTTDEMRYLGELRYEQSNWAALEEDKPFELPNYFTSVLEVPSAMRYLKSNNCLDAFANDKCKLRYDPRQDRVVFLCEKDGKVVQATGRALSYKITPKWYKYGHANYPFVCQSDSTFPLRAIVVEDAASACAVFNYGFGIALNGTHLSDFALAEIKKYPEVILALDFDATKKAIDMLGVIKQYVPKSRVVILRKDLKYCNAETVAEILR